MSHLHRYCSTINYSGNTTAVLKIYFEGQGQRCRYKKCKEISNYTSMYLMFPDLGVMMLLHCIINHKKVEYETGLLKI